MNRFQHWMHLARPFSLAATFVPITITFCMVIGCFGREPFFKFIGNYFLALLSCGCLQISCNMLNSWGDYRSGLDTPDNPSNQSEIVFGILSPNRVLTVALLFNFTGAAVGSILLWRCFSIELLALAVIGIFGSLNYSTGIKFKYRGFGVPFVFFLMGVFLMMAADLVFGGLLHSLFVANLPVNAVIVTLICLSTSGMVANIMHANDMRDIEKDAGAGIKTTASLLGPRRAATLFTALHLLPHIAAVTITICFAVTAMSAPRITNLFVALLLLLPLLTLPRTIKLVRTAWENLGVLPHLESWGGLLPQTAKLFLQTGLLYCVTWIALFLMFYNAQHTLP